MSDFAKIEQALEGLRVKQSNKHVTRDGLVRPGIAGIKSVQIDENGEGVLNTGPLDSLNEPNWDDILRNWNLNPDYYEVVGDVAMTLAEGIDAKGNPKQMASYRVKVRRRRSPKSDIDLLKFVEKVAKRKPGKRPTATSGDGDFSVVLADWQTGKGEGGGTVALIHRISEAIDMVEDRIKELRKAGRSLGTLNVIWPGDSVEGCGEFYAMQEFQTDMDRRQQIQVATDLLDAALTRWSLLFDHVRVIAVAGNHGENRKFGKAFTTFGDNDDLLIVENVARAYSKNEARYGHIHFYIPEDHLNAVVNICDGAWSLGVTHGHLSRGGGNPESKVQGWYNRMAGGKHAIGLVDILITGHYHHHRSVDWGGCHWMQAPAFDGGSEWFTKTSGMYAKPQVLTFCSYPDERVTDVQLLTASKEFWPPSMRNQAGLHHEDVVDTIPAPRAAKPRTVKPKPAVNPTAAKPKTNAAPAKSKAPVKNAKTAVTKTNLRDLKTTLKKGSGTPAKKAGSR